MRRPENEEKGSRNVCSPDSLYRIPGYLAKVLQIKSAQIGDVDSGHTQTLRPPGDSLQRGLLISGTVGILEHAPNCGLLKISEVMKKLLNTNFRIDGLAEQ